MFPIISEEERQANIDETYQEGLKHVKDQLASIAHHLEHHSNAPRLHWGHIGDIEHVSKLLSDVTAFLEGR